MLQKEKKTKRKREKNSLLLMCVAFYIIYTSLTPSFESLSKQYYYSASLIFYLFLEPKAVGKGCQLLKMLNVMKVKKCENLH